MGKHYKVWIEVEEIDEDADHYEKVPVEFGPTAIFLTAEKALSFAEELHLTGEKGFFNL